MPSPILTSVIVALTSSTHLAPAEDAITFRRVYKAGEIEVVRTTSKYETDSITDMEGEEEKSRSTQDSVAEATYEIKSVAEDGTASFTALFKTISIKMTADGDDVAIDPDENTEEKGEGKIDQLGRISDFEYKGVDEEEEDPFDVISNFNVEDFTAFPNKAVSPGDTWEIKTNDKAIFEPGSIVTGKFVGVEEWKGKPAYKLEFSGTPKIEIDVAKLMGDEKPPFEMLMKGGATFKTTKWVEPGTFMTLRTLSVFDMTVKMDVKDIGLKLEVRSKGTDDAELKR